MLCEYIGPTSFLYIYILLDGHKWAIPSAITPDQHKETTVRQMIHHIGLFSSDDALESKMRTTYFAQTTTMALSNFSHLTDISDPSCDILDPVSQADLKVRLRFTTLRLFENQIQPLTGKKICSTMGS